MSFWVKSIEDIKRQIKTFRPADFSCQIFLFFPNRQNPKISPPPQKKNNKLMKEWDNHILGLQFSRFPFFIKPSPREKR